MVMGGSRKEEDDGGVILVGKKNIAQRMREGNFREKGRRKLRK